MENKIKAVFDDFFGYDTEEEDEEYLAACKEWEEEEQEKAEVNSYWNEDNEAEQDAMVKEYTKKRMMKAMAWY